MAKCEYCNNGKVKQGKSVRDCPYCMSATRLVDALRKTITDDRKEGKKDHADKLQLVLNHLPEYPVVAVLEAEYLGLNSSLILLIQDTFEVLPFGDQNYKKQKSG